MALTGQMIAIIIVTTLCIILVLIIFAICGYMILNHMREKKREREGKVRMRRRKGGPRSSSYSSQKMNDALPPVLEEEDGSDNASKGSAELHLYSVANQIFVMHKAQELLHRKIERQRNRGYSTATGQSSDHDGTGSGTGTEKQETPNEQPLALNAVPTERKRSSVKIISLRDLATWESTRPSGIKFWRTRVDDLLGKSLVRHHVIQPGHMEQGLTVAEFLHREISCFSNDGEFRASSLRPHSHHTTSSRRHSRSSLHSSLVNSHRRKKEKTRSDSGNKYQLTELVAIPVPNQRRLSVSLPTGDAVDDMRVGGNLSRGSVVSAFMPRGSLTDLESNISGLVRKASTTRSNISQAKTDQRSLKRPPKSMKSVKSVKTKPGMKKVTHTQPAQPAKPPPKKIAKKI